MSLVSVPQSVKLILFVCVCIFDDLYIIIFLDIDNHTYRVLNLSVADSGSI